MIIREKKGMEVRPHQHIEIIYKTFEIFTECDADGWVERYKKKLELLS
jgi:hypothetical protein